MLPPIKLFFNMTIVLIMTLSGCAHIEKIYYSKPATTKKNKGYLIRGSGVLYSEDDDAINDSYQLETQDYIAALKINNRYDSMMAVGMLYVPQIPLFGITKDGYKGEKVTITVALFFKNNKKT